MTDISLLDMARVLEALGGQDAEDEARLVSRAARIAGEDVHLTVKDAAMSMPTARGAIGVGMHVAAQVLVETLMFACNSVDGGEDGALITQQARKLFDDLVAANLDIPGMGKAN